MDTFYSMQTQVVHPSWSAGEPFIEKALTGLRAYCEHANSPSSVSGAVAAMERASRGEQPPWPSSDSGMPPTMYGVRAADPLRIVADYLVDASSICTEGGTHLDPTVVVACGQRNRELFSLF
jgi:hypothetical protein